MTDLKKVVLPDDMLRELFSQGECFICGYDGANYYQPPVHSCAEFYHGYKPFPPLYVKRSRLQPAAAVEAPGAEDVTIKSVSAEAGKAVAEDLERLTHRLEWYGKHYFSNVPEVRTLTFDRCMSIAEMCMDAAEALTRASAPEWQPIETAPKGREMFLARCPAMSVAGLDVPERIAIFSGEILQRAMDPSYPRHLRFPATHWMPLPDTSQLQASPQPETTDEQ